MSPRRKEARKLPPLDRQRQNELNRESYMRNRKSRIERIHKRRDELIAWYREYKASLECERCGFKHPAVIDFHHKNPSEKEIELCFAARRGWSIDRMRREISKCEVLCANCHRIEHWEQRQAPVV